MVKYKSVCFVAGERAILGRGEVMGRDVGEARVGAYMGSSEEGQLQQGPGTAILQCKQEGCTRPEQLISSLVQVVKVFTVAWHKVIVLPV